VSGWLNKIAGRVFSRAEKTSALSACSAGELFIVFIIDYTGWSGYAFFMQKGAFEQRRPERMENSAVSLIYTDEKYEVWVDAEKDNITLSMTDRGVTILFTREEWLEFQEVIGNIMLEEEPEEEENE